MADIVYHEARKLQIEFGPQYPANPELLGPLYAIDDPRAPWYISAINASFAGFTTGFNYGLLYSAIDAGASGMGSSNTSWINPDGSMYYPPNDGAVLGSETKVILHPGQRLGRYGEPGAKSRYFTEAGADPASLSLPPETSSETYIEYEVIKDIPNVTKAKIAPWGGDPGGGTQYVTNETIIWLKENQYIKVVN